MQETQSPARTNLFYVALPIKKGEIPRHIDAVLEFADGERRGWFSNMTQDQLAQQYGHEIALMEVEELARLTDEACRTEPKQITEEQWIEALEVLPPMRWGVEKGVESFRCSEFYSGNITDIYARCGDSCWTFRDNAYMSFEEVSNKVLAAMGVFQA